MDPVTPCLFDSLPHWCFSTKSGVNSTRFPFGPVTLSATRALVLSVLAASLPP
jgi:hypothetical protein